MADVALKVLVVANKTWECEPVLGVLTSRLARAEDVWDNGLRLGYHPASGAGEQAPADWETRVAPYPARPRLHARCQSPEGAADVELWCIEDWMRRNRRVDEHDKKISSSSSHEKWFGSLPLIRQQALAPDLVIALGTAGIPTHDSLNGCVSIGTRIFVRDAFEPLDPDAEERRKREEKRAGPLLSISDLTTAAGEVKTGVIRRDLSSEGEYIDRFHSDVFAKHLSQSLRYATDGRFLETPINPARPARALVGRGFASLGTLNVTSYDDYVWADDDTMRIFERSVRQREIGSMETTHGLIRLTWPSVPFLYVSGLTDVVGAFNADVTPRVYTQNFVAAHNAGVAVAMLIPRLADLHATKRLWA